MEDEYFPELLGPKSISAKKEEDTEEDVPVYEGEIEKEDFDEHCTKYNINTAGYRNKERGTCDFYSEEEGCERDPQGCMEVKSYVSRKQD